MASIQSSLEELPGNILVFAPHPDDEVIACGGTIIKRIAAGHSVHILFSTDGSRSHKAVLGITDDPTPEELVGIRRGEAVSAAAVLGVPADNLHFAGATDSRLADSLPAFRDQVDEFLSKLSPVELYCPHETRELNADHSLTGRLVLQSLAAFGLKTRVYRYVVWDEELEAAAGFTNRQDDRGPPDATDRLHREDISGEIDRKYKALLEHRSQISLFSKSQTRPVLPEALLETVRTRTHEEFWMLSTGAGPWTDGRLC